MHFEPFADEHLEPIVAIYNHYIRHSTAIYFTEPLTATDVRALLPTSMPYQTTVAIHDGKVVGFGYFHRFSERQAFDISVEMVIYFSPEHTQQGHGQAMLRHLEEQIQAAGFHNIVGTVNSTNTSSQQLLIRNHYQCVGSLNNIAEKFGERLTLLYFQKSL